MSRQQVFEGLAALVFCVLLGLLFAAVLVLMVRLGIAGGVHHTHGINSMQTLGANIPWGSNFL
jgi:hypothetical protein